LLLLAPWEGDHPRKTRTPTYISVTREGKYRGFFLVGSIKSEKGRGNDIRKKIEGGEQLRVIKKTGAQHRSMAREKKEQSFVGCRFCP